MYKDELQKKNGEILEKEFSKYHVPLFIQCYFVKLNSKASQITYWNAIKDLLLWSMKNKIILRDCITDIVPEDLSCIESVEILNYLKDREKEGMAVSTLATRKQIFSSFWEYLCLTKYVPVEKNMAKVVQYSQSKSEENRWLKLPSTDDLLHIESNMMQKKDKFIRQRNVTILRLLMGTGIREGELAGLNMNDLRMKGDDRDTRPFIKVVGKGRYRENEYRKVLLNSDAYNALLQWLPVRRAACKIVDTDAVFLCKNGSRVRENNIKAIFKNYGEITPHMVRHWYATQAIKKFGVAFVAQQLGHKSINTTLNIYVDATHDINVMDCDLLSV